MPRLQRGLLGLCSLLFACAPSVSGSDAATPRTTRCSTAAATRRRCATARATPLARACALCASALLTSIQQRFATATSLRAAVLRAWALRAQGRSCATRSMCDGAPCSAAAARRRQSSAVRARTLGWTCADTYPSFARDFLNASCVRSCHRHDQSWSDLAAIRAERRQHSHRRRAHAHASCFEPAAQRRADTQAAHLARVWSAVNRTR
jgi:hypothetical protein